MVTQPENRDEKFENGEKIRKLWQKFAFSIEWKNAIFPHSFTSVSGPEE